MPSTKAPVAAREAVRHRRGRQMATDLRYLARNPLAATSHQKLRNPCLCPGPNPCLYLCPSAAGACTCLHPCSRTARCREPCPCSWGIARLALCRHPAGKCTPVRDAPCPGNSNTQVALGTLALPLALVEGVKLLLVSKRIQAGWALPRVCRCPVPRVLGCRWRSPRCRAGV